MNGYSYLNSLGVNFLKKKKVNKITPNNNNNNKKNKFRNKTHKNKQIEWVCVCVWFNYVSQHTHIHILEYQFQPYPSIHNDMWIMCMCCSTAPLSYWNRKTTQKANEYRIELILSQELFLWREEEEKKKIEWKKVLDSIRFDSNPIGSDRIQI